LLTILIGLVVLLPLALLRRALRLGLLVGRQRRQWRTVPLAQRNMTRATFGGFVVAFCIGFAATGIPFHYPAALWALAGVGGLAQRGDVDCPRPTPIRGRWQMAEFVADPDTGHIQHAEGSGKEGVRAVNEVLTAQIQSQTKIQRGLYALASLFVIVAAFLVVFAPQGRERASEIIGVALIVVSAGCAGFGTFAIKLPFFLTVSAGPTSTNSSSRQGNSTVQSSPDPDIAKAAAQKFDEWMKRFNHSATSDRQELLDWLVSDFGYAYFISREYEYGVFQTLAKIAAKSGYDTLPPPSRAEFTVQIAKAQRAWQGER